MTKYTVRKITILLPMIILAIIAVAGVIFFELIMVLNMLVGFYVLYSLVGMIVGLVTGWYLVKAGMYMLDTLLGE